MSKWCYWKNDGAPIHCRYCEEVGATIVREFPDGERGVYHEECANELWDDNWKERIIFDKNLITTPPKYKEFK